LRFGQNGKNLALQFQRHGANGFVSFAAVRQRHDAMSAAIGFVLLPLDQAARFHALEQGGDGVRIAADEIGDIALSDAFRIGLDQRPQNGELIRSDAGESNAAAKGLVEIKPAAAQKRRQPAAAGRVERQRY